MEVSSQLHAPTPLSLGTPYPVLSQADISSTYIYKIQLNYSVPTCLLVWDTPKEILYTFLVSSARAIRPAILILSNLMTDWLTDWQSLSWSRSSRLLWNPKIYYRLHKSPLMVSILSQFNPVDTYNFCKISFNTIIQFTCTCRKWYLPFRSPD